MFTPDAYYAWHPRTTRPDDLVWLSEQSDWLDPDDRPVESQEDLYLLAVLAEALDLPTKLKRAVMAVLRRIGVSHDPYADQRTMAADAQVSVRTVGRAVALMRLHLLLITRRRRIVRGRERIPTTNHHVLVVPAVLMARNQLIVSIGKELSTDGLAEPLKEEEDSYIKPSSVRPRASNPWLQTTRSGQEAVEEGAQEAKHAMEEFRFLLGHAPSREDWGEQPSPDRKLHELDSEDSPACRPAAECAYATRSRNSLTNSSCHEVAGRGHRNVCTASAPKWLDRSASASPARGSRSKQHQATAFTSKWAARCIEHRVQRTPSWFRRS